MKLENYKITSVEITNFGQHPLSYGADIILNNELMICFSPFLKEFFLSTPIPVPKKHQKFYNYFNKLDNFKKLITYLNIIKMPHPKNELIFYFKKLGINCKIL